MSTTDQERDDRWGAARRVLAQANPAEFQDGDRFRILTPSQRLDVLASLTVFVHEFRGLASAAKREGP